jgi:hypothetical protein
MADIEIVCVNRDSKHNRIVEVGIRPLHSSRVPRLVRVQDAIARCAKGDRLYVDHEGKTVRVEVVDGPTRFYLRTHLNGDVTDNLNHLRSCFPTSDPKLAANMIDDFLQGKL